MGHPVRAARSSPASARPSSRRSRGAASCSSRPRRRGPRSPTPASRPADIDGMVTFTIDTNDEIELMRSARHPGAAVLVARTPWRRRAARQHDPARGRWRSRRARPNAVLVYRAFNERSGRRFGQPNAPARRPRRPIGNYVPAVRARHAGEDVRALVPALHARVRRDQRGLRPLHGRRPQARGDQPERVVLRAADHARGPPGVALDRRARAAPARLLPGERRRRRAGGHHAPSAPATCRSPAVRIAARSPRRTSATGNVMTTTTATTSREFPEAKCARRPALRAGRASGPTTSTTAIIYENFSPFVFLQLEELRLLRPGRGARTSSPTATSSSAASSPSTRTAACSARPTSTA